ncbi:amino acid adenylation domain-containing protein [Vibrio proteolyticus]
MTLTVLDQFAHQKDLYPHHTALVTSQHTLSYQQLDQLSDKLCGLIQHQGVKPNDLVPLIAHRDAELIIGVLAILKAGAAYVPIDARYPDKRVQTILDQIDAPLILTSRSDILPDDTDKPLIAINTLDKLPHYPRKTTTVSASMTAYVIFTSGTTGAPKGVMISHASLWNLIHCHNQRFAMSCASRSSLMAGISFDVAQWELWSPLCCGATLCLPDDDIRLDPHALLENFAHHQLTHAFVPTVMIPEVLAAPQPDNLNLQYLFTAGEKLSPVDLQGIPYILVDYYGPTETTVFTTCHLVECRRRNQPASIGYPVAGARLFVLDERQQPVARGQAGELYITGPGVAQGYLNAPELNQSKFVRLPTLCQEVLFRSGDRVIELDNGQYQYLGRLDDQIKIRGNRIELAELNRVVQELPEITHVATRVIHPESAHSKRIATFVISQEEPDNLKTKLRQHLKTSLPDYFQPNFIEVLTHFPLTENGKVDLNRLTQDLETRLAAEVMTPSEALTDTQAAIAAVWSELLGVNDIRPQNAFFDVGGDSLLAVSMITQVSRRLGIKTYVRDVYEYPSLNALAAALETRRHAQPSDLDREPSQVLQQDIQLPSGWKISAPCNDHQLSAPQLILLTGATGFVGAHLLAELLRTTNANICCLVRGRSPEHAGQRLLDVLKRYRIGLSEHQLERIQPLAGDIADTHLGLLDATYDALCQQVDVIYHSASAVNFIQPYSYMRRDNVQGLQQIIAFAAEHKTKPLVLLSTISVYSWGQRFTGKRVMYEHDDIDQNLAAVSADIGYVRSKWVMEKIADQAAHSGLPVMTFRLGYATCHSQTGVSANYQWWGRLVETCLQTGSAPQLRDLYEGLTTVDYMTQAIAYISRNPKALGLKFNLIHQHSNNLSLEAFFQRLNNSFDLSLKRMPYPEWRAQWEQDSNAPLYPLLSLFKDNVVDGLSTVELYQDTYIFDNQNTARFLRGSTIEEPVFDKAMLARYLEASFGYRPLNA